MLMLLSPMAHAEQFTLGDCIHVGTGIYKVTVIGKYSYGMQYQNDTSSNRVFLLPKMDVEKIAVKSDCIDAMQKKHEAYLKSILK